MIGDTVFVVAINHKHGLDTNVFTTRELAEAYLYDYVKDYWDVDGPDEPIPEDPDTAIDRYFHHAWSEESYTLQQSKVRE